MGQKRWKPDEFFLELERCNGFFTELDALIIEHKRLRDREQRAREKRARGIAKAAPIRKRIDRVEKVDLWYLTRDIEPDFFGDNTQRIEAVKKLHEKKQRILWCLRALHHYWAYGHPVIGHNPRKGMTYKKVRRQFLSHLENHREKLRQDKWDKKREKVRKRRNKIKQTREEKTKQMLVGQIMSLRGVRRNGEVPLIDTEGLEEL